MKQKDTCMNRPLSNLKLAKAFFSGLFCRACLRESLLLRSRTSPPARTISQGRGELAITARERGEGLLEVRNVFAGTTSTRACVPL